MGAFHHLFGPQRETDLRIRLDEYLRVGLEAGIFYESIRGADHGAATLSRIRSTRARLPRRAHAAGPRPTRRRLERVGRRARAGASRPARSTPSGARWCPRETPDGFLIEAAGGALTIGAGRMYVDGLLVENHGRTAPTSGTRGWPSSPAPTPVDYAAQPYLPNPPPLPAAGPHLVYLDVWQREVRRILRTRA